MKKKLKSKKLQKFSVLPSAKNQPKIQISFHRNLSPDDFYTMILLQHSAWYRKPRIIATYKNLVAPFPSQDDLIIQ